MADRVPPMPTPIPGVNTGMGGYGPPPTPPHSRVDGGSARHPVSKQWTKKRP